MPKGPYLGPLGQRVIVFAERGLARTIDQAEHFDATFRR